MMRPAIAGGLAGVIIGLLWPIALHAAEVVRFPVPTDPKQFASVVAAAVYPLVLAAEESSGKKTR